MKAEPHTIRYQCLVLDWVSVNRGGRRGGGGHPVKILKWAKGTSYYSSAVYRYLLDYSMILLSDILRNEKHCEEVSYGRFDLAFIHFPNKLNQTP